MLFVVCCVSLIFSLLIEAPFLAMEKSLFSLFDKKKQNKKLASNKIEITQVRI